MGDVGNLFDIEDELAVADPMPDGSDICLGPNISLGRDEEFINMDGDFDPNEWFSVCVLTVPDVDRFPIPKTFSENKIPVDLSGLDELSWGDVRRLIQPSVSDDQLAEIETRERSREKPRAKVLEAITEEQSARGDGFRQWVISMGRNPLTCRISAIAYQVGTAGECVSMAIDSLDHERAALEEMAAAWHAFDNRSGFSHVAGWDLDFTLRVLSARRAGLGIHSERQDFRPCMPVSGRNWADHVAQAGGLQVAAVSLGIASHEIPEIAGPMDVWRVWRNHPGLVELSDWCAGQLMLERELLTVTQRLW